MSVDSLFHNHDLRRLYLKKDSLGRCHGDWLLRQMVASATAPITSIVDLELCESKTEMVE